MSAPTRPKEQIVDQSPLVVSSDTISELFNRKPSSWSDSDLLRMTEYYRTIRATFSEEPKKRNAPQVAVKVDLSLEDLGL
jgi:hypothetical protein